MAKTVLYARVSTSEQNLSHQQTQAEAAGFKIDEVVEDQGVSGVSVPLADRDGGKRLFDILRDGDVLVVRWIDRLGRNYDDIQKNIRLFLDRGVTIKTVINNMTFDAKPSFTTDHLEQIQLMMTDGIGNNEISRRVGLSKFAVSRICKDVDAAYAKLQAWS